MLIQVTLAGDKNECELGTNSCNIILRPDVGGLKLSLPDHEEVCMALKILWKHVFS